MALKYIFVDLGKPLSAALLTISAVFVVFGTLYCNGDDLPIFGGICSIFGAMLTAFTLFIGSIWGVVSFKSPIPALVLAAGIIFIVLNPSI